MVHLAVCVLPCLWPLRADTAMSKQTKARNVVRMGRASFGPSIKVTVVGIDAGCNRFSYAVVRRAEGCAVSCGVRSARCGVRLELPKAAPNPGALSYPVVDAPAPVARRTPAQARRTPHDAAQPPAVAPRTPHAARQRRAQGAQPGLKSHIFNNRRAERERLMPMMTRLMLPPLIVALVSPLAAQTPRIFVFDQPFSVTQPSSLLLRAWPGRGECPTSSGAPLPPPRPESDAGWPR